MERPEEVDRGFRSLMSIISVRKGLFFVCFLSVSVVVLAGSFLMPPTYRASTTIMIEPEQLLRPGGIYGGRGYIGAFEQELFMGNQKEIIRSRTIAEKVVKQLHLDKKPPNPPSFLNNILDLSDKFFRANPDPLNEAVAKLRKNLSVESTLGFSILELSIKDKDPIQAARSANTIAEVYTNFTYEDILSKTRSAYGFIKGQVKSAKWKLDQARQALRDFKEKMGVVDLEAETRLVLDRLAALNALLSSTLSEYPENDPRIVRVKQEIGGLSAKLERSPQKELELAKLTQIAKSSEEIYSMLLTKLEEARISENTEIQKLRSIKVIDPATPPAYPLRRKKAIFAIMGFVMSIVFALSMAFFAEYKDTSIKTPKDVKQYLHLNVLGSIPLTPKEKRKCFLGFGS